MHVCLFILLDICVVIFIVIFYCDVVVAQINYPSLKHNTQDSIKQVRGRSHDEDLVQIFMLYVMQLRDFDL
jgi:hypothetical protein